MAKRTVVTKEDEVLSKVCKPVENFDNKLAQLLDDMKETMYASNGVGLAAPQVAILRRICVIDVGEGYIELINPEILESSGSQRGVEGCLSCPNEWGYVTRPNVVTFKAQDRNGQYYEKTVEGLFARCVCHETDHLDGKLFLSLADEMVAPDDDDEE